MYNKKHTHKLIIAIANVTTIPRNKINFRSSLLISSARFFGRGNLQEPTETSKQPITTCYLGHVTGFKPIRDPGPVFLDSVGSWKLAGYGSFLVQSTHLSALSLHASYPSFNSPLPPPVLLTLEHCNTTFRLISSSEVYSPTPRPARSAAPIRLPSTHSLLSSSTSERDDTCSRINPD
eukprot:sb/3471828/